MSLAEKTCVPCRGGVPPLAGAELEKLQAQLPSWRVVDGHHLEKTISFPDFASALDFVNKAGAIAEEQGHHPDILLRWGNDEQQRRSLPRLARDTVASFALSEAGSGSDAFALTTRAFRDGDRLPLSPIDVLRLLNEATGTAMC